MSKIPHRPKTKPFSLAELKARRKKAQDAAATAAKAKAAAK